MFETGLLILTRPVPYLVQRVQQILTEVASKVSQTLYVHIQPGLESNSPNVTFCMAGTPCNSAVQDLMSKLYSSNASVCQHLNIYVLLGNISNQQQMPSLRYTFQKPYDVVLTDVKSNMGSFNESSYLETLKPYFTPASQHVILNNLALPHTSSDNEESGDVNFELETFPEVVMGGTFDRIHAGHKILLGQGCLLANDRLTVGVTEGEMNKKKVLPELILPAQQRLADVQEFIETVKPSLGHRVVPITDMFGPTITDPNLQCIVLSEETRKGGKIVNEERVKKGMCELTEHVISMVEDSCHSQYEEEKVSSSSQRKRLLGTIINPLKPNPCIQSRPYVIGLTGGIASGKSAICKRLEGLGAASIDCDKLGHQAYSKGTKAYHKVVEEFGESVVREDGEINRKNLGQIVFSNPEKLKTLNSIVWPEIGEMVKQKLKQLAAENAGVVVLEAALLLEAGWDELVHEVWTTIIPREEAVRRVIERNNLSMEEVEKRIDSQMSNQMRVQRSNVILSSLWEYEYTQQQVEKAWHLLMERLKER